MVWKIYFTDMGSTFNSGLTNTYTQDFGPYITTLYSMTLNQIPIPIQKHLYISFLDLLVMTVLNKTHVNIKQISDDKKGKVVDDLTVIKDVPGPPNWI
ncbi:unnamed protein product [Oppiella nova]|uniref:Uncharacterized protein n=1 Tax=Oppiella nova TaxID=334625 RepID=A0A7R9M8J8_9ACAR|nr:unnamed protein product [Oppiella nova]CAG2172473.1 unnamed protein product [Oppiella nova]